MGHVSGLFKTPVAEDSHVVLVEIKTEATCVGYSRVSTNMESHKSFGEADLLLEVEFSHFT